MEQDTKSLYNELLFDAVAECAGRMIGDYVKAVREGRDKDAITKLYGVISLLQLYALLYQNPQAAGYSLTGGLKDLSINKNIVGFATSIAALAAAVGKMAADRELVVSSGEKLGRRTAEKIVKYLFYRLADKPLPPSLRKWVESNEWAKKLVDEALTKGFPLEHFVHPSVLLSANPKAIQGATGPKLLLHSMIIDNLKEIKEWFNNPRLSDLVFADAFTSLIAKYYSSEVPHKDVTRTAKAMKREIIDLMDLIWIFAKSVKSGVLDKEKAAKLICSKLHGIAWNAAQYIFAVPAILSVKTVKRREGRNIVEYDTVGEVLHKDLSRIMGRLSHAQKQGA